MTTKDGAPTAGEPRPTVGEIIPTPTQQDGPSLSALPQSTPQSMRIHGRASLASLREKAGVTQEVIAARLQVQQGNISKIESRGDLRLSTLQAYIDAIGGRLELQATIGGKHYLLDISETRGTKRPRKSGSQTGIREEILPIDQDGPVL